MMVEAKVTAIATTGSKTNITDGSVIYSQLNGTHEIVGAGSGFVVIEKQRDVQLKADETDGSNSNATVSWSIGTLGEKTGGGSYTGKFFCVWWWCLDQMLTQPVISSTLLQMVQ